MNKDKLEIISEQLLALTEIWDLILSTNWDQDKKGRAEELLLHILKFKQLELNNLL